MSRNPFNRVGKLKPRRNTFDLSYRKNFTCDMGQLIPVLADEVVPGDFLKLGNELVIRFQPLAAPIMHEIAATVHYFFVPYRILWDNWESFISQGDLAGTTPLPISIPVMDLNSTPSARDIGSLWDYFGLPVSSRGQLNPNTAWPIDMPWRAYNRIFNEYYRDQDLQDEVNELNTEVLNRAWRKDYFTAARPFLQKGQSPALPVNLDDFGWNDLSTLTDRRIRVGLHGSSNTDASNDIVKGVRINGPVPGSIRGNDPLTSVFSADRDIIRTPGSQVPAHATLSVDANDIGWRLAQGMEVQSTTFNVSDLRLAFQTQKWLERNARAGTRYTEFLQAHFGVSPSDSRLDRPEYIGGTRMPVVISEVLQTSQTAGTPQGTMTGHGLAADGQFAGSYNVQEYGVVIALLSVMPKPSYQDGINRQWLRKIPTDFYFPEFAHLSEQAIKQVEIFAGFGTTDDERTFGYTGQYDEMRIKNDMVCSEMRHLPGNVPLSSWNMSRKFDNPPMLNSEFITCVPRKDIFLVEDVPGLIVNCQNIIRAVRPLPLIAEPGMVDHF
jgi:hypothetical protein